MLRTKWVVLFAIAILLFSSYSLKPQSLATASADTAQNQTSIPTGALIVPDKYPTIQSAIVNATAGDTVFVRKGTYYYRGNPGAQGIIINKTLSLIGEDSQNTILQVLPSDYNYIGEHQSSHSAISVMADNVTISGFTIDGAWYNVPEQPIRIYPIYYVEKASGVDFGIGTWDTVFSSHCKIMGNNIVNFLDEAISIREGEEHLVSGNIISNSGGGISVQSTNSVISSNSVTKVSYGINVNSNGNITIKQNNIADNGYRHEIDNHTYTGGGGLSLSGNGSCYIYENNVAGNINFGIQLERANNAAVYKNNVVGNDVGIYVPNFAFPANASMAGLGNKVYYNNIVNNTQNALVEQALPYNLLTQMGTWLMEQILSCGTTGMWATFGATTFQNTPTQLQLAPLK